MVPGVGELMQVSFPNNDQIEFTEWFVHEKSARRGREEI